MKSILIVLSITLFSVTFSQDTGLGLRIGDLNGLTFKKYMGENAIEISLGRSNYFSDGDKYHNDRYNDWYNDKNYGYYDTKNVHIDKGTPLGLQVHYLFNNELDDVTPGLSWYWGLGGQLRWRTYEYSYDYRLNNNSSWQYDSERVTNMDIGFDGVAGVEYTMADLPLSFFLDVTLFIELADDFLATNGQAGLGARYNF